MPGVQISHPTLRSVIYTVEHEGRKLTYPLQCWMCGTTHVNKTYHLRLDAAGKVTVSEVVFQRLKEAGLRELRAETEIRKPPTLIVGVQPPTEKPLVISREHGPRS